MSTSLLKRAAETIKRTKDRTVKAARENQHTTALVASGIAGTGTAVAAAFADQKMGEGKQWKVGPIPAVAIAGAAALVPAFFTRKYPIVQAASVAAGMTAINISAYRYLVEEGIEAGAPG
jgi:uncharacterized membrane protein